MNNNLISRQETIEHVKHRLFETAMNNISLSGVYEELADNRIETWINELPTAEPRKGRDVSGEAAYYCDFKCSQCGADIGIVEGGVMDGGKFNYCPNCGARMTEV